MLPDRKSTSRWLGTSEYTVHAAADMAAVLMRARLSPHIPFTALPLCISWGWLTVRNTQLESRAAELRAAKASLRESWPPVTSCTQSPAYTCPSTDRAKVPRMRTEPRLISRNTSPACKKK